MFRIKDNAIAPRRAMYERAIKHLPVAHRRASAAGIAHLHYHVSKAAEDAGLDSSALSIGWHKSEPYLGIQHGSAGDQLFDHEFGTPDSGPNPVLRQAVHAAHPGANSLYNRVIRNELGV